MLVFCFLAFLSAQSGGTVEGTVSDSQSRAGLPAVAVTLTATGSTGVSRSTFTDGSGAFRFMDLPPGEYQVAYSKEGFGVFTASRDARITSLGETVSLKGELVPLGAVSGRVLDQRGQPIPKLAVSLSTASRVSHIIRLTQSETDKDGRFRFQKLEPGSYMIEALPIAPSLMGGVVRIQQAEDSASVSVSRIQKAPARGGSGQPGGKEPLAPPRSPAGEHWMWANTYYPGVLQRSQAARVVIHAGWDLPGYDISLQAVPVYGLRGIVYGEDGSPAPGLSVGLSVADRWEHDSDGTKTNGDGSFEFPAVHQGDWSLAAHGPGSLMGFAAISVGRHDLENVVLRLAAPFTFTGSVEFEGAQDGGNHGLSAVTLESATRAWGQGDSPGADGSFHIPGVYADRYTIYANGRLAGYYLASMRLGDREVTGQEVDLAPGLPPLRVIFKPATGRVTGTVENGGGATVVLLPKEEALITYQYIRSAKCDSSGRYQIDSLKPGDYFAVAFAAPDLTALEDPDFVRTFSAGASSAHVENGAATSVDLKLMPWPE